MQFDPNEVLTLLNIIEKEVAVTGGRLVHTKSEAFARLNAIEEGLANAKRQQQGLPPTQNEMVDAAKRNDKSELTGGETEPNPTPSTPIEAPKSEVAKESPTYQPEGEDQKPSSNPTLAEVRRL